MMLNNEFVVAFQKTIMVIVKDNVEHSKQGALAHHLLITVFKGQDRIVHTYPTLRNTLTRTEMGLRLALEF